VKVAHIFTEIIAFVTLTFQFLTPKSNQHIYECKYIFDQNWVKLPSLEWEIWRRSLAVTLTFYLLT